MEVSRDPHKSSFNGVVRTKVRLESVQERRRGEQVAQKGRTTLLLQKRTSKQSGRLQGKWSLKKHFLVLLCEYILCGQHRVVLSSAYKLAQVK